MFMITSLILMNGADCCWPRSTSRLSVGIMFVPWSSPGPASSLMRMMYVRIARLWLEQALTAPISKIFAINLTTAMLGLVYWQHSHSGTMPTNSETAIKVATSAGTVIGQIVFGYAADWLGRKKMYGIELIIILAATLAQSLTASSTALSLVGVMVFWRFMMGIGIGGDYPLSAVITSEYVYSLPAVHPGST
jgi:MFS family permease